MSADPQNASTKPVDNPPLADDPGQSATISGGASTDATESTSLGLQVRCPHCREAFSIAADTKLTELTCDSCGREFNLAGEEHDESATGAALATVAHFELLARVGVGGFGTVWRARDAQLDRIVALKVPRKEQLDPKDVEQFLHEARIAAQLSHPNIVKIFEVGRDGDTVYLVSEFMEGKSLLQWSSERQLSPTDVAQLIITILRALSHAHAEGVIHRDLKPQNVLMDERGEPHITDFGLAKRLSTDVTRSIDGKILGTPAYMSPEQARGALSNTDGRTDLYSIGVMLFQLLTGELPFRGTIQRLIFHVLNDDPPKLTDFDPSIPIDLETICLKLLEKEPVQRYASADEVADELERFCRNEPIRARPVGAVERLWRWCKRRPAIPVLFASLVLVMLLVSTLGWRWYRGAADKTERALTAQALRGTGFAAESVARNATQQLEDHYALIESLSVSPEFLNAYWRVIDDDRLAPILDDLNNRDLPAAQRDELRFQLLAHPAGSELQRALQREVEPQKGVFGWFVMRADGLQVARWPVNDTIGVNYSWRNYFHGLPRDFASQAAYEASSRPHIERTHLSAAFVSQVSDRWVIVISTPLRRPAAHPNAERFEGIVALMFEVGQITDLPGGDEGSEFAVLVDGRQGSAGMILQHPLYEHLLSLRSERLPDQFQTLRVNLDGWAASAARGVALRSHYRDPLADDPLGASFDQRWLAAKAPVLVRGRPTGLEAIVQQSYRERIGNELDRLDRQVRFVIGGILGLVLALVVPVWALVLRKLDEN